MLGTVIVHGAWGLPRLRILAGADRPAWRILAQGALLAKRSAAVRAVSERAPANRRAPGPHHPRPPPDAPLARRIKQGTCRLYPLPAQAGATPVATPCKHTGVPRDGGPMAAGGLCSTRLRHGLYLEKRPVRAPVRASRSRGAISRVLSGRPRPQ